MRSSRRPNAAPKLSSTATRRLCARSTTRTCGGPPTAARSATATATSRATPPGISSGAAQSLSDADVVAVGATAVLTAIVHDEYERAGEPGEHSMRLTLVWVEYEGTWKVLAGHAGPSTT